MPECHSIAEELTAEKLRVSCSIWLQCSREVHGAVGGHLEACHEAVAGLGVGCCGCGGGTWGAAAG